MASISGSHFNTKKAAAKAAKKLANIQLEDDERLILLDSGSSLDAADIAVDFPHYLPLVIGGSDQHSGNAATTACGGIVTNKGRVVVDASLADKNRFPHSLQ